MAQQHLLDVVRHKSKNGIAPAITQLKQWQYKLLIKQYGTWKQVCQAAEVTPRMNAPRKTKNDTSKFRGQLYKLIGE